MRKIIWMAVVAVTMAGCGAQGVRHGDDDDDDDGGTTPTATTPVATATVPDPTPTPTPSGPVYLESLYTPDDLPMVSGGKCLGFTLVANGVTFADDIEVSLGEWDLPVALVDATHARVGEEATGGVCTWLPVFLDTSGTYSPVVRTGDAEYALEEKITVLPMEIVEVGRVAETRVWEAGSFEKPWDTDIYLATFDDTIRRYADMDFFSSTTVPLVPHMMFLEDRYGNSIIADGGVGLIFPQGGPNYVVVRDVQGLGGAGADYSLAFLGDTLFDRRPADDCAGAPYITAQAYHITYDELSDDFQAKCPDQFYGDQLRGGGKDGVWKVKVPAHTELRVSTYDDHIDNVVFLLPIDGGCPHQPTTCVAAADHFGGGSTDTLVYDNDTDVEEEYFLIHDGAYYYDHDPKHPEVENPIVGQFLIDVELFPR